MDQKAILSQYKPKFLQKVKSVYDIPENFRPKYILKRIAGEDIEIDIETRDKILSAMSRSVRFVQIKEFTIMVNSINSIDPKWGNDNIPPKPKPIWREEFNQERGVYVVKGASNAEEINEWERCFGNKVTDFEVEHWEDVLPIDRS